MNRLKRELAQKLGCHPSVVAMTSRPELGLVQGQNQEELALELAYLQSPELVCPWCGWSGRRMECVHPKHDVTLVLCPQCYDVAE